MQTQLKAPPVTIRIIRDEAAWDAIENDWNDLFDRSPYAATPLRFSWLRSWWKNYGASYAAHDGGLQIITAWHDNKLIAALPLYDTTLHVSFLSVRRLGFISTGEDVGEETCPDYLNLLCAPGEEKHCVRLIQSALHRLEWDVLELGFISENSPLLKDHSWGDGPWEVLPSANCPIATITGGFDKYLQRLSSKHRKNAKRVLRFATEANATLELATPATASEFFNDLVRVHQQRWNSLGQPGCFAAPRFKHFHHDVAMEGIASGRTVLARLVAGGTIHAVVYGFITAGKFDVYQSGVSIYQDSPIPSPGVAAHLMLMDKLSQQGVRHYDFLRGTCQYKNSLSTEHAALSAVRAWRPTVRALAHRSFRFLGVNIKPNTTRPDVA